MKYKGRYISDRHTVVRTEGRYNGKDQSGEVRGYFTLLKRIGFNHQRRTVYLAQDIFGVQFNICGADINNKGFGKEFYAPESRKKNNEIHQRYNNMINRCYNVSQPKYLNYWGKGIKVCAAWLGETGRETFIRWAVATNYQLGLTLDRLDSNGDYEPSNCQWLSKRENSRKTSKSILSMEKAVYIREEFSKISNGEKRKFFIRRAKEMGVTRSTMESFCYNKDIWT